MATTTPESLPLMKVADVERKAITNNLHPISIDSFNIECSLLQLLSNFADGNNKVSELKRILSSLNSQPTLESIMYIVCELVELVSANITNPNSIINPTTNPILGSSIKRMSGIAKASAATDTAQVVCAWCSGVDTIITVKEPTLFYDVVYNIQGLDPPTMTMEAGVKIITILEKTILIGQLTYTISGIIAGMKITNAMNASGDLLKEIIKTEAAAEVVVEDTGCFPCWARKKIT